ncbi:MAG TPA: PIN domain-containing protein [Pedobacter sp.]|uniref:type II toxin-antitoxin system VapC family toxin n=1 Tax=Pedobacter sp. TaxID=1411316 RepID=UPI002BBE5043|nr:PIN domain-containing protein [Pedobacter sp.]HMI03078.1 PIN domain-containing protein [Pedobacter sp.]
MAFKIFLDANILLDFLLKRDNYKDAKQIMILVVEGKVIAYITPAIVHIVGYWLTKAYGSEKAKRLLLSLVTDVRVIDSSHELTLLALNSKIEDIEDALQYYTAIHNQLDYFLSGDKKFQKAAIPTLPVVASAYFLNEIYR